MGFFERLSGEEPSLFDQWVNCDDKGHFGEYLVKYALSNNNISGYSKILSNVYVPYRGKTSEIDVLLLHERGIFVFENKNYSGWIFGSAEQRNWTQCLINKEKHSFYNPILQNRTHINALSNYLGIDKSRFISYIVFSKRCELKKIPPNTDDYIIIKRTDLIRSVQNKIYTQTIKAPPEGIDYLYNKLYPLTEVTEEQRQYHIESIKKS